MNSQFSYQYYTTAVLYILYFLGVGSYNMELCSKPRKTGGVKHCGYYLSSFHFWSEIYNYCCCVSSCLQTFLYLSHCGPQKWHSQGEVMTSFACKNPGGKNHWIKYCFHISLACLWGKVHLGLAGGHVVLMAQGWQSCLADKGIIHIALSL